MEPSNSFKNNGAAGRDRTDGLPLTKKEAYRKSPGNPPITGFLFPFDTPKNRDIGGISRDITGTQLGRSAGVPGAFPGQGRGVTGPPVPRHAGASPARPAAATAALPASRYYLLRIRRGAPIVAARLRWTDCEPDTDNALDRGRGSLIPLLDVAGELVPPELLWDRLGLPHRRDFALLPHEALALLADPAQLTPRPVDHWAWAQPVDEATYRYHFDRLRWAERNAPADPALAPRTRVDPEQLPLPDFSRERSLVAP